MLFCGVYVHYCDIILWWNCCCFSVSSSVYHCYNAARRWSTNNWTSPAYTVDWLAKAEINLHRKVSSVHYCVLWKHFVKAFLVVHRSMFFLIRFWYLRCCGCPWNRGRQHLATPLKTCQNIEAGFLTLPIPQLRRDGIWDSAVPALGLCACRCPRKRGIIRLATMTTLPEHQSVDDCRRSLLLPRLKQLVTLRREGYIRIYLLLDGLAWSG